MRTITEIDKAINLNRRGSEDAAKFERECELFRQRGLAQLDRDERQAKAAMARPFRMTRRKKCSACGR